VLARYTTQPGDTLAVIAARHGVSLTSLLVNNADLRDPNLLETGTVLRIPAVDGVLHRVSAGETIAGLARRFDATAGAILAFPGNALETADALVPGALILVPGGVPPTPPPASRQPRPARQPEPPATPESPAPESPAPQPPPPPAIPAGPAYAVEGVNLREGPGTDFTVIAVIPPHGPVQVTGLPDSGFYPVAYGNYWGWASGQYLEAGDPPAPPATPSPPPADTWIPGTGWDDYPWPGLRRTDQWGFAGANCTSFVAWRINHNLGIPFQADMGAGYFGDARYWDAAANAVGYRVDNNPTPGSIAHWSGDETLGGFGHVAFVMSVNSDGSVNVEEYNAVVPFGYSQRTLFAPRYIHIGP
jgi:surface antigen